MIVEISECESPGLEVLLVRLCSVLPDLSYRDLRDILHSLTLLHTASSQLATLDTLLDQELANRLAQKLAQSSTQAERRPPKSKV